MYEGTETIPKVIRPLGCVVGCTTCANLCMGEVITFPDIETVRAICKEQGIWKKVKDDLKQAGKPNVKG